MFLFILLNKVITYLGTVKTVYVDVLSDITEEEEANVATCAVFISLTFTSICPGCKSKKIVNFI